LAQRLQATDGPDIFLEAPPAPRHKLRYLIFTALFLLILAWAFQGAKIRLGELLEGIPQIAQTLGRMLPPDFSKLTDSSYYYFPDAAGGTRTDQATLVEQYISADRIWGDSRDRANGARRNVHGVDCGVSVGISCSP